MTDPNTAEWPDCPKCGCNAVRIVGRGAVRFGRLVRRLRCDHCHYTWTERESWPTKRDPLPGYSTGAGLQTRPDLGPDVVPVDPPPPDQADVSPGGAVRYHVIRCPECGSDDTKITSSPRPIRYHKCRACGHTFKSVEQKGPMTNDQ